MGEGEGQKGRLVLVLWPYQGHVNPMLRLGGALHAKGFAITVAHPKFNSPNPSDHPHFTFLPLDDSLPDGGPPSDFHFIQCVRTINANVESSLRCALAYHLETQKIACVIYDSVMYKAQGVTNELKIPSIVLNTGSGAGSLFHVMLPRLQEQGHVPTQASMVLDPVPEFHPFRFKDLPIFNLPRADFIIQMFATITDIKDAKAVILDTAECIEEPFLTELKKKYCVPIFPVGPLHKVAPSVVANNLLKVKEDTGYLEWLDKQAPNSVIYASIGTVVSMNERELVEIAWGLANSEQPFLWVIRQGSVHGETKWTAMLPEKFKATVADGKGCVVEWVSQTKVLAHPAVGGFWSHCGWNSTIESISQGVLVLCRPQQWDQFLNARYLSYVMKMGLTLEEDQLERGQIEVMVRRLMVGEEAEEMRQRAIELKLKVDKSIEKGGASYNAVDALAEHISSFGA